MDPNDNGKVNRRRFLKSVGVAASVPTIATATAGCSGTGEDPGDTSTTGSDGTTTGETSETVTVEDMAGRTVEVPKNPERFIGVGGGTVRFLDYMNLEDQIVGVEDVCKDKSEVRPVNVANNWFDDTPSIGGSWGGSPELISKQNPDVIFSTCDKKDTVTIQQKTGTPTVFLDFGDLWTNRESTYEAIRLMGDVTGETDRAEELTSLHKETIDEVGKLTEDVPDSEKTSAWYGGKSYRGARGITGTKYPFPPFRYIDAKNAANLDYDTVKSANVNREKLLQWDPEVIFVNITNLRLVREDFENHPEYEELSAVQSGEIYGNHPMSAYQRIDATMLGSSYFFGEVLFPEQFSDVDFPSKMDEIYEKFHGKQGIHQKMVDGIGELVDGASGEFGPVDVTPER
ncbi:MAG: ABC transporter substrate-binding protein [Halodesulfurarchaeum sp.]